MASRSRSEPQLHYFVNASRRSSVSTPLNSVLAVPSSGHRDPPPQVTSTSSLALHAGLNDAAVNDPSTHSSSSTHPSPRSKDLLGVGLRLKNRPAPKKYSSSKSTECLSDPKTRYANSIKRVYEATERARHHAKENLLIWDQTDSTSHTRKVRSETDLVNDKFQSEFPRTSLYIRELQLNGLSFLKSKLDTAFTRFSTNLNRKHTDTASFPSILTEYFQDYSQAITRYLESCSVNVYPIEYSKPHVKLLNMLSATEPLSNHVKMLCAILNFDHLYLLCMDFFRKREIFFDKFALDFGRLEEENSLLKDVLAQGASSGKPIDVMVRQAFGTLYCSTRSRVETASKSTSASDNDFTLEQKQQHSAEPPIPKKRGVKFADDIEMADIESVEVDKTSMHSSPPPPSTLNLFGTLSVQTDPASVRDVSIQVETPNKAQAECLRLKQAFDSLNKQHTTTIRNHEEEKIALQVTHMNAQKDLTVSLEAQRGNANAAQSKVLELELKLAEIQLACDTKLAESKRGWEDERRVNEERHTVLFSEKEALHLEVESLRKRLTETEALSCVKVQCLDKSTSVEDLHSSSGHDSLISHLTVGPPLTPAQENTPQSQILPHSIESSMSRFPGLNEQEACCTCSCISGAIQNSPDRDSSESLTKLETELHAEKKETLSLREKVMHLESQVQCLVLESHKSANVSTNQEQTSNGQYLGLLGLLNMERRTWMAERDEMKHSIDQYQSYVKELEDQLRVLLIPQGEKSFSLSEEYDMWLRDRISANTLKIGVFEQENNRLRELRLKRTDIIASNAIFDDDGPETAPTSRVNSAKLRTRQVLAAAIANQPKRTLTKGEVLELDMRHAATQETHPSFKELAPAPFHASKHKRCIADPVVLLLPSHQIPVDMTAYPYEELKKPGTGGTSRSNVKWAHDAVVSDVVDAWNARSSRPTSAASTFATLSRSSRTTSRAASANTYRWS
ncbi:hypothetical protein SeMB42_g00329 [Synchytrium endobioticum]|uniref:Uncharacterized protein n=1 Tax=Synchytrium endobioticum TaxID=286115 RepID=A0A507DU05_9FUNG|nr:hypothetical protein SeMB42_g00329 [Synchytrium endobioticum]